ncbi:hypothetical protein Selin_1427 [Desulfurispirillum indicum S5]|uniref:Uncharacterized protein n=1 Tax=Desulfurispirillum indicum (strain ATCC BAA-1389 / DSM 22839 / S5) TaxID=653733 RepID=E6W6C5_DESIS|nr:hypothetical protein [Desulfurispirillum indicum]ADU66161.1 hypothetical protein Selin_1427 [Desulfurispirillum indicum S5]
MFEVELGECRIIRDAEGEVMDMEFFPYPGFVFQEALFLEGINLPAHEAAQVYHSLHGERIIDWLKWAIENFHAMEEFYAA